MSAVTAAGRAIHWTPVLYATGMTVAGGLLQHWTPPDAREPLLLLMVTLLAAGAAAVLEDDATPTLAGSPTDVRARTLIRMTWGLGTGAVAWALTVAVVRLTTGAAPSSEFTLLWSGLTVASLSLGAAAVRAFPDQPAGLLTSAALLLALLLFVFGPPVPSLGRLASAAPWDSPWERLGYTLVASAGLTTWGTRDPACCVRRSAT